MAKSPLITVGKKARNTAVETLKKRLASQHAQVERSIPVAKPRKAVGSKLNRTIDERLRQSADSSQPKPFYNAALEEHRRDLRDLGLDPDLIGEHEVDPVMCNGCGEPIPWHVLLKHRS